MPGRRCTGCRSTASTTALASCATTARSRCDRRRRPGPSARAPAFTAIDADSSPIRFRACFTLPPGTTGDAYPEAVPLTAPGWFDCFDAGRITQDLASGAARAVLGEANIRYGIDRVLALYPDGRGYAWTQIDRCGKEVFDGNPPPAGCPPVPPGVSR